jgi:acyl-CoA thioesterase
VFTNARPQWQPPLARGIYGGAVISLCIASAQKTVPDDYLVHSCHCYFLLAGSADLPLLFHVERVRDGRSFATRTVQARQRGKCIFTTTVSFTRDRGDASKDEVHHATLLPADAKEPPEVIDGEPQWVSSAPIQSPPVYVTGMKDDSIPLDQRRGRQWVRARGKISPEGGHQAHINALAYMSDSYFIGLLTRIHRIWRYPFKPEHVHKMPEEQREQVDKLFKYDCIDDVNDWIGRPELGMIVSLDHSIYFHAPRRIRADEWMLFDMESPWSGDGRGLVLQKIFARDGTLLATCIQEVSFFFFFLPRTVWRSNVPSNGWLTCDLRRVLYD